MRLVLCLASLCLAMALCGQVATSEPVVATVYYEAKCPYSREFVAQQLLPAVLRDPEIVRPVLIPFGKANITTISGGYNFTCQHGDTECLGNRLHACGIAVAGSKTLQVSFAACLMADYTDLETRAATCAEELGLPASTISDCANGAAGSELMRAYGNTTKALSPPLTSVPTVTLNGDRGNQAAILDNFWEEVVKLSEGVSPTSRASHGEGVAASSFLLLFTSLLVWLKA